MDEVTEAQRGFSNSHETAWLCQWQNRALNQTSKAHGTSCVVLLGRQQGKASGTISRALSWHSDSQPGGNNLQEPGGWSWVGIPVPGGA